MIVRPATAQDAKIATELLVAQMREHDIAIAAERIAQRVEAAIPSGTILVAVKDTVIGVAWVSFAEPLDQPGEVAWIEELYVLPAERERGAGAKLVEAVIALADERGCIAVELETKPGHERAGNLYRRHGFRDLGRTHYARPIISSAPGSRPSVR